MEFLIVLFICILLVCFSAMLTLGKFWKDYSKGYNHLINTTSDDWEISWEVDGMYSTKNYSIVFWENEKDIRIFYNSYLWGKSFITYFDFYSLYWSKKYLKWFNNNKHIWKK